MTTFEFDLERLDMDAIHSWIAGSYWSAGISRERVEQGFRASTLCVGAFVDGRQVGVARCVSDTTRFAYVADVFVDEAFRGRGIGRALVQALMAHPLVSDVDAWHLSTRDAQGVYAALGFEPIPHPERHMVRRKSRDV